MEVVVAEPNFWWRVTPAHLNLLVGTDPDVEDGHQRWPDRDDQHWDHIAAAVDQVSQALATGNWVADTEDGWEWRSTVEITVPGLTLLEHKIVQAWFSRAQPVRVDPWFPPLQDGRHRLWNAGPFFDEVPIPIKGDSISYANPADMAELGEAGVKGFANSVQELQRVPWFDRHDPVNQRFIAHLEVAGRGEYPALA